MAETKEPKRVPHLKELFKTGEMLTIPVMDPSDHEKTIDVDIWIRKPTSSQHEEALTKGRSASARRRNLYRDKDSDLYVSLVEEVNEYKTKDELVEKLLSYEDANLRQKAYHEVLFVETDDDEEEEPRWGRDGRIYVDLLTAVRERYLEIQHYNSELTEDEEHLRIKLETDEELLRLNEEQDEFQREVEERFKKMRSHEAVKLHDKTEIKLREELRKRLMELDIGMTFYQEYKSRLLYFSCRHPEQKDRLYWDSPNDIWEQPQFVQQAIMSAVDAMELGPDEIKNSLSLLSS